VDTDENTGTYQFSSDGVVARDKEIPINGFRQSLNENVKEVMCLPVGEESDDRILYGYSSCALIFT
jgi:hypothetical protein